MSDMDSEVDPDVGADPIEAFDSFADVPSAAEPSLDTPPVPDAPGLDAPPLDAPPLDLDQIERDLRDVESALARPADGTYFAAPGAPVPGAGAPRSGSVGI